MANVFNAPVYTIKDTTNSACLGCAYRAKHGLEREASGASFMDAISAAPPYNDISADPWGDAEEIFDPLTARYKHLENMVVDECYIRSKRPKLRN